MQSLELSPDHAAVLKICLERTLSDLSMEIAATDGRDFREHLKAERRLLAETLEQLTALR
jgi:hypothetical protein